MSEVSEPTPNETDPAASSLAGVLGRGVLGTTATVDANDLAFTRGDGCFEATRVVTDATGSSTVDHLEAHLGRLARSAAALDIPVDLDAWRALIDELVAAWSQEGEAVLRLFLTAGDERHRGEAPVGIASIAPIPASTAIARQGITVVTLSTGRMFRAFADAPWLLGGVKTLSYATNMAATRVAQQHGADDALLVSSDGFVLEGPRAAVVWRHGDRLTTTDPAGTGVLHSITQRALFAGAHADGVDVGYGRLAVADLPTVDGAWLVSSGRLVIPIDRCDGTPVPRDAGWDDRCRRWVHTPLDTV